MVSYATKDTTCESAEGRQRYHDARFEDGHAALLNQVHGEPREEEVGKHPDAVLADVDADEHPFAQQELDVIPAYRLRGDACLVHVDESAAGGDMVELGACDAGMLARRIYGPHPRGKKQDSRPAEEYKHR